MVVLGLILLIIGLVAGISILTTLGIILLVVGLILNFVPIGGNQADDEQDQSEDDHEGSFCVGGQTPWSTPSEPDNAPVLSCFSQVGRL